MDASQVTSAVKSGFTLRNILLVSVGVLVLAAILDFFGLTKWLIQPVSAAKETWQKAKAKAALLVALAVPAALAIGNATMGAFAVGA